MFRLFNSDPLSLSFQQFRREAWGLSNPLSKCHLFQEAIPHWARPQNLVSGQLPFSQAEKIPPSWRADAEWTPRAGAPRGCRDPELLHLPAPAKQKKPPRTLQEKPDVFEIKNVLCLGLKQNTFTALAVLTNQRSYLIQDSCDCLNNIPGDAASLPPCVHSPRCRHTHGISNRISSPLSLSLSLPRFHNLSLSNLPTLLYFPIQYSPSNTFPSSSAPTLAPSPPPPGSVIGPLSPGAEFWVSGHPKHLAEWLKRVNKAKSNFSPTTSK